MTSYRTKEEVEKEFEKVSYDTDDEDFNLRNEPAVAFSDAIEKVNKLRLSDLESIIEAVESMKFEGDLAESSERRHNTAINSVLSYLKSLKQ
jgi:hypothetical protein